MSLCNLLICHCWKLHNAIVMYRVEHKGEKREHAWRVPFWVGDSIPRHSRRS